VLGGLDHAHPRLRPRLGLAGGKDRGDAGCQCLEAATARGVLPSHRVVTEPPRSAGPAERVLRAAAEQLDSARERLALEEHDPAAAELRSASPELRRRAREAARRGRAIGRAMARDQARGGRQRP
jgi:hypothetical protein